MEYLVFMLVLFGPPILFLFWCVWAVWCAVKNCERKILARLADIEKELRQSKNSL
jgi:hypothetical protein